MADANFMAYWYNLAWQVRSGTYSDSGKYQGGLIEKLEKLAFAYEMESASVKKAAVADVARDIFGNIITKGKRGKEKVQTEKASYIVAKLKTQKITFQTCYQSALGTTDILGKIEEIRDMIGNVGPLVIGCEYTAKDDGRLTNSPRIVGIYQMQLTKADVSDVEVDEIGRFTSATVKFTLTESKNSKVMAVAMTYPGDAAKVLLCSMVKNGFKYTEVSEAERSKKNVNPKKNSWYELDGDAYVLTQDKKPVSGKTYYTRSINTDAVPERYWSALKCSPDPNAKAMVKQKKEDEKIAQKNAKEALKTRVKELQDQIRAGT